MKLAALHRTWGLTAIGLCCAACSEGSVPIGEQDNEQVADATFAGTWDGYIESYHFDSGSDRIRLVLDANGKGQLRFGDRELIPKPTDQFAQYYPPQLMDDWVGELPLGGFLDAFEGFNYPIRSATVQGERLRLSAATSDIYEDFCAIQVAPYPGYRCEGFLQDGAGNYCVFYSRTPYTGTVVGTTGGDDCLVAYDRTPTTIAEMTSIPQRQYCDWQAETELPSPWRGEILKNVKLSPDSPDYSVALPSLPPHFCQRDENGVYHSAPADSPLDRAPIDIGIDASLEKDGNALVGTLTTPVLNQSGPILRTVRFTRVSN
jgi:hypothetical protein